MQAKTFISVVSVLTIGLVAARAEAIPPDACVVRLSLQLTPDAVRTKDPGFLSSLVANPQYEVRWIQGTDTTAVVELIGPASDDQCSEGVTEIGRSSHVLNVHVIDPTETTSAGS